MIQTAIAPDIIDFAKRDFSRARDWMVNGQLRPNKVSDRRILDAMRALPREAYLPPGLAALAYIDADIDLGAGRVMMSPLVLARLIQLGGPRMGETALIVGAGALYGAAILALCGARVTALESDPSLIALGRANIPAEVKSVEGPLALGWPAEAPYDFILIEGAVRRIPEAIGAQLSAGGRLVTVISPEAGSPYAALAEASTEGLRAHAEFDAVTKLIPELMPLPAFRF